MSDPSPIYPVYLNDEEVSRLIQIDKDIAHISSIITKIKATPAYQLKRIKNGSE